MSLEAKRRNQHRQGCNQQKGSNQNCRNCDYPDRATANYYPIVPIVKKDSSPIRNIADGVIMLEYKSVSIRSNHSSLASVSRALRLDEDARRSGDTLLRND